MTEIKYTEIPTIVPIVDEYSARWQKAPLEDAQIKVWSNRGISGMQYFAFDIRSTAGSAGDATFRDVNLVGFNYDLEKTYNQEIISTLGNTTAFVSKRYTIDTPTWKFIKLLPWKIFEAGTYFGSATQSIKFVMATWSYRFMEWGNLTLSNANQKVTLMNVGNTDLSVKIQYNTTAAERPSFWVFIKIF